MGFTKINSLIVWKYPNGKLSSNNGKQVMKIVNRKYPEMSGYYTKPEFNRLAAMPNWNF